MKKQRNTQTSVWGKLASVLLGGLSLAFLAPGAIAQQNVGRTQDSGSWNDGNWSDENGPSGSPGSTDNAYIGFFDLGLGWAADAIVDLDSDAEVSNLYLGDGASFGILNINAGATLQVDSLVLSSGSTLNLSGTLGVLNLYANGGTINQDGAFFVDSAYLGWGGEASVFNRTSGDLYVNYLNLGSASSLSIGSSDTLTSVDLADGSTLTVESQVALSNLSLVNSTLVLNDNLDASSFLSLDNSTLVRNNNATFSTGDLYLYGMDFEVNGSDSISNSVSVYSAGTLTFSNPTFVPGSIDAGQSTVNVDASVATTYMTLNETILNVNADLDVSQILYTDGGTINQNGNISGSLYLGWAGTGTLVNRNSGVLTLTDLSLGSTELALGSGDSVVTASIYTGSTLTINDPMQIGGLTVGESTLILNDNLTVDGNVSLFQATVIRNNGAGFATPDLYVSTMDYQLDGTDNVSNSINFDNGTLDVSVATSLSSVTASLAIVNVNADVNATNFELYTSTLNLNAALQADSIYINGGEVVQNGDISSINLLLGIAGDATNFQRISGSLAVDQLQLSSGSQLNLSGIDTVAGVTLFGDSLLTYQQLNGQMTGLDLQGLLIESGSNLNLLFDGVTGDGLDWGLRLAGDQQFLLNELLGDGRLTSNWMDADIVYDAGAYGDYTYFGAFTAVPEPSACTLLAVATMAVTTLRRRERQS